MHRIKSLTSDAWLNLLKEWPPDPKPSSTAAFHVLGIYLVAGLVLAMNEYVADYSYDWLPLNWTKTQPPGAEHIWWALVQIFSYVVPPVLYLRFVMRRPITEMGLSITGIIKHLPIYALFAVVVMPLVVLVSGTPHFLSTYPMAREAAAHWETLLVWEILYAVQFIALEFFFRGFMIFGPVLDPKRGGFWGKKRLFSTPATPIRYTSILSFARLARRIHASRPLSYPQTSRTGLQEDVRIWQAKTPSNYYTYIYTYNYTYIDF